MIVTKWTLGALKTGLGEGGYGLHQTHNQFIFLKRGHERQINEQRTMDVQNEKQLKEADKEIKGGTKEKTQRRDAPRAKKTTIKKNTNVPKL